MEKLRNSTLLFLVKKSEGEISEVCLAMKKRDFGVGRWNGVGGKVNPEETVEEGAKRETQEEIGVFAKELKKVAELYFYFSQNSNWNQLVHVYVCENWDGEPAESEEMNPKWFSVSELPFEKMWPDDTFWLPKMLKGELIRATFEFGEGDVILDKEVKVVGDFSK